MGEEEIRKANVQLKAKLESQGDGNDSHWAAETMTAQSHLNSLQNKKALLEAKLLVARVNESRSQHLAIGLDENCTCSCAQELYAVRKLLERTQGLCAESTIKLKHAAMEAYSLSDALNKVQGTLREGAENLEKSSLNGEHGGGTGEAGHAATSSTSGGTASCLKYMHEASQHAVYSRLHGSCEDPSQRNRREARRARLLQDSHKFVYLLTPSTPSMVVAGSGSAAATTRSQPCAPSKQSEPEGPFLTVQKMNQNQTGASVSSASPSQQGRLPPARGAEQKLAASNSRSSNSVATPRAAATPRASQVSRQSNIGGHVLPPVANVGIPAQRPASQANKRASTGASVPHPRHIPNGRGQVELGISPTTAR